jgi:hypothetical protein
MSDDKKKSDLEKKWAVDYNPKKQNIDFTTEIFAAITQSITGVAEDLNGVHERSQEVHRLVLVLEKGMTTLYEFAMKEKERSDKLEQQLKELEKKFNAFEK